MIDARSLLRAGTRAHHDRVDAAFSGFDLTSREGYERFLIAHARAIPAAEAAADGAGAVSLPIDWAARRRTPALMADLTALGLQPPPLLHAPQPANAAELWGMIYVLEGSRMGGQLLAREASRNPDAAVRSAIGYLGKSGASWPRLIAELQKALHDEASARSAVSMAARTFELFEAASRI